MNQTPIAAPAGLLAYLRIPLRALGAAIVTAAAVLRWALGAAWHAGSPARRLRHRRTCMQWWCRALCRVLGVQIEADPPPADVRFLVANHLGYLDILVLGSLLPVAFVSRADVAGWPLIGWLARSFDTVFLERARKRDLPGVNATLTTRLADQVGALVLFPEGTSTAGATVLAFRASLLAPAAEAGIAVHTACLRYETSPPDAPASISVCWAGDAAFLPHACTFASLRRVRASVRFAPQARRDGDRKRLASQLQGDVEAMFRPTL